MIETKSGQIVVVIASDNKGKVREFRHLLSPWQFIIKGKPEYLEIDETGKSFAENARLKATLTAREIGEWTLADDSGLPENALDGKPGIYSSRYANTDKERIDRLLPKHQPMHRHPIHHCINKARP